MSELVPDTRSAIEFLQRWCPEGPWVLTAIIPDGAIETATFQPENWQQTVTWIDAYQGKRNLYFHVNPVRRKPLHGKASKEDIARMAWLHVDIDPRAGESFKAERERALKLLQEFDPPPTVIIDSGGGYQGFWKLRPSAQLEIDGSIEKAQELEAYNIQLEKLFQGDHCHNVDRIMRLPGTINVPNERKKKKGRKYALAKLVRWEESWVYPLDRFTPAVRVQSEADDGLGGGRPRIKITGNVPSVGVEELQAWASEHGQTITEHTLAVIASGADPVDPTRYPSRSEALFRVCCELVRAEVPDEMIYAVITGTNEISASVLEQSNWESYALRQIERAHEEVINPMLRYLNEKHAVISDIGSKCRIISEVWDPALKRTRLSKQSFADFHNRYMHKHVVVGYTEQGHPIEKAAGTWWTRHPNRRQYETIVFAPGQEVDQAYNLWRGFACDSLPGNKHESYLHHIYNNICSEDMDHYQYLLGWMARTVQHPDGPGEVAVVLRGRRGTGKSFFARVLSGLFGRHFLRVSDSKHLVGSFNAHLRDTVLVFGDEAFFAGDKKHESVLKTLVTEETLLIEGKGVDAEVAPNYVHLVLASNEDWVVPAGLDERRFFVIEMGEEHKQDLAYFSNILKDLETGGYENLLHFLRSYDLREFEVRHVPQTLALQEQKVLSMSPETQWMFDRLLEGQLMPGEDTWQTTVVKDDIYENYLNDMRDQGRNFRLSRVAFGRFLTRVFPGNFPVSKQAILDRPFINEAGFQITVRKRVYVYELPSLADTRQWWDEMFGGPFNWAPVAEDQADLDWPKGSGAPF